MFSFSASELWHSKKESWICEREFELLDEDLLLESIYSLVSLGTEGMLISNHIDPEIAKSMSVPYMKGDLNGEFTYGYSLIGRVINGPDYLMGKVGHVMHPHQDKVRVKTHELAIVPSSISNEVATLASNMETAVNAIWDAQVELGDQVLVIGYGTIGGLIADLCNKMPGVSISVLEIDSNKATIASNRGLKLHNESKHTYDIIFNTSSNGEMLQEAIEMKGMEARVIELSWYGSRFLQLNLGGQFHYGRKQIICSQVSHIPYRKQPKWNYKSRKKIVFKLLEELNPSHLIDTVISFDNAPSFFNQLRNKKMSALGTIIEY